MGRTQGLRNDSTPASNATLRAGIRAASKRSIPNMARLRWVFTLLAGPGAKVTRADCHNPGTDAAGPHGKGPAGAGPLDALMGSGPSGRATTSRDGGACRGPPRVRGRVRGPVLPWRIPLRPLAAPR